MYVEDSFREDDLWELGDSTFVPTPELIMELTKRIQKPHFVTQQEKLLQARDNVEDFSENHVLQRERTIRREQIEREIRRMKEKILRERNPMVSELSGRPLDGDAEVHHLVRVADCPEKALDPDNMIILKRDEHQGFHRSSYPPTPDGLWEYAEEHRKEWEAELRENRDV